MSPNTRPLWLSTTTQRSAIPNLPQGELVLRKNEASRVEGQRKLDPTWEGPYRVHEAHRSGSYKLTPLMARPFPVFGILATFDASHVNLSYLLCNNFLFGSLFCWDLNVSSPVCTLIIALSHSPFFYASEKVTSLFTKQQCQKTKSFYCMQSIPTTGSYNGLLDLSKTERRNTTVEPGILIPARSTPRRHL